VAAADVRWLLALLGPIFDRPSRRRQELGLDIATCARGVEVICALLAEEGPLTRAALGPRLAARGLPTAGQALIHLLGHAAWQGAICQGPDQAGEPAYVLLDDWVPAGPTLAPAEATLALVRRYLAGYAPAGPADFAAWSGLPRGPAQAAWAALLPELIAVEVAGRPAWLPAGRAAWLDAPPPAAPLVRLLPAFDTYLLGYQSRALALAPEYASRIHPGGGLIHPTVLVDGQVAGAWRMQRRRAGWDVVVAPFAALPAAVAAALPREVAGIGHFLGEAATLTLPPPA
ncbi:MAG TPA: winged helix DNA-binding domain-containing protein, partial [Chloroflexia bacterium]|nr:winged helix DNA-binding domain-containing protein [Chloroflexia bacterium]